MEDLTRRTFLKYSAITATGVITVPPLISSYKAKSKSQVPFEVIAKVEGNLKKRMEKNYDRLEIGRYLPEALYVTPNAEYHEEIWPGDMAGRLILGQTLLQKVSGREAKYLKTFIDDLPNHFNELGYMGKIYPDVINEQQLSGHGWLLRGLCEYYLLTKDPVIPGYLKTITKNLILPTAGQHKNYPIDPELRKEAGGYMGSHQKVLDGWMLSSDVGCDFIFMDGVIQTYSILQTEELKSICYEMAGRFLEADLYKIKAQTHASLTAMRGLMRLYELTGEQRFLEGAVERYDLYKSEGMTETYENFNWFQRPEWTELCAVVDSYQLVLDLWKHTSKAQYLEDSQLIWYNGISYAQRDNGGFGLSNCPGPTDNHLQVNCYEAHWCCTMRGAEGIAERVQSLYFTKGNSVLVSDMQPSVATIELPAGRLIIRQKTDYPFGESSEFMIQESSVRKRSSLKIFVPGWINELQLTKNGEVMDIIMDNQFLIINEKFEAGNVYRLSFSQNSGKVKPHGNNTAKNKFRIQYGPLVLGLERHDKDVKLPEEIHINRSSLMDFKIEGTHHILQPVYHLMDEKVNPKNGYKSQVLFQN